MPIYRKKCQKYHFIPRQNKNILHLSRNYGNAKKLRHEPTPPPPPLRNLLFAVMMFLPGFLLLLLKIILLSLIHTSFFLGYLYMVFPIFLALLTIIDRASILEHPLVSLPPSHPRSVPSFSMAPPRHILLCLLCIS